MCNPKTNKKRQQHGRAWRYDKAGKTFAFNAPDPGSISEFPERIQEYFLYAESRVIRVSSGVTQKLKKRKMAGAGEIVQSVGHYSQ